MTRVRALISFSAFNYIKSAGEEFIIEDKGERLDMELLGFVEPISAQSKTE
jgi:hypothetical protein